MPGQPSSDAALRLTGTDTAGEPDTLSEGETDMGLLEGKVALITGGARGQGCAHAVTSVRRALAVQADVQSQGALNDAVSALS